MKVLCKCKTLSTYKELGFYIHRVERTFLLSDHSPVSSWPVTHRNRVVIKKEQKERLKMACTLTFTHMHARVFNTLQCSGVNSELVQRSVSIVDLYCVPGQRQRGPVNGQLCSPVPDCGQHTSGRRICWSSSQRQEDLPTRSSEFSGWYRDKLWQS